MRMRRAIENGALGQSKDILAIYIAGLIAVIVAAEKARENANP
jgi:hypothetical protein